MVHLIASGRDKLLTESVNLGVALLWGGNDRVQDTLAQAFETSKAVAQAFFYQIRQRFRKSIQEISEMHRMFLRQREKKHHKAEYAIDSAAQVYRLDLLYYFFRSEAEVAEKWEGAQDIERLLRF